MIGNKILLDTNIVIEFFKGNSMIKDELEVHTLVNIPFAVLGELYLGAYRSSNPEKHLKQINDFLERCNVIIGDEETANNYALIKTKLLEKGKPIPENDIWIGALAKEKGMFLATRDAHFQRINGLNLLSW